MNNINQEIEELKAAAVKLQQQIEALEKPKQWKPTVSLDWVDRAHISTYTLLLKYVKEFGGDWNADWENMHQEKCYVYYGHNTSNRWNYSNPLKTRIGGTVYMSEECAKGLVAKLNSGEVVL
tara:strand:- start:2396 stop:2761 length:366 start_codon:yes stop_codon:yes gene_type:complete